MSVVIDEKRRRIYAHVCMRPLKQTHNARGAVRSKLDSNHDTKRFRIERLTFRPFILFIKPFFFASASVPVLSEFWRSAACLYRML